MNARALRVSPDLALPLDTVTSTLVVYGGKGMGKTNVAAVLVEELKRAGLRVAVLDPVGVWWGLQHAADGKGPGVEVLVLGGVHGDIPIEPTAGQVVADLVADEEVDVVVDVSRRPDGRMWTVGEKVRFVADYCARLYERQGERRRPLHQVIDEAGRFVPQVIPSGAVDLARCIGAIEQLVELGRNVGVGVTLITQRSARMNKSVSELADCMIAFRTIGPRSVDAIMDWLGEHVERGRHKALVEQLRTLPIGTALVVSPGWLGVEATVRMRPRETFDSSATPSAAGGARRAVGAGAKPDLAAYRARMAATIERAEASDPAALRRALVARDARVAELERALAEARADSARNATAVDLDALRKLADRLGATANQLAGVAFGLRGLLASETARRTGRAEVEGLGPRVVATEPAEDAAPAPAPAAPDADPVIAAHDRIFARDAEGVSVPERKVLDALATYAGFGEAAPARAAVAAMAGLSVGGGYFQRLVGGLRAAGLVEVPRDGRLTLTDRGRRLARSRGVTTLDELHEAWLALLKPPQRRVLKALLDVHPGSLTREELADLAALTAGGGYFQRLLSSLRSLEAIEDAGVGEVRASSLLFPPGLPMPVGPKHAPRRDGGTP